MTILLILGIFLHTFGQDPSDTCSDEKLGSVLEGTNYVLIWGDEFSIDGPVCSEKWHHQTQLPESGSWFNGEVQHYTNRIENSFVEDGLLKIIAKKENYTDQGETKPYTSARLNSKFAFTGGRVDVKAKLPAGAGTWPAIWTLGRNISEAGGYWYDIYGNTSWPACGEIDIMEHWGNNPDVIHGSIHTPSSFGGTINTGTTNIPDVSSTFHVYSIIWDNNQIKFFVDDINYYIYRPASKNSDTWPFVTPQYLLLNIAMGGIGGAIDSSIEEVSMEIDYVRVYELRSDLEILSLTQSTPYTVFAHEDQLYVNTTANEITGRVSAYTLSGRQLMNSELRSSNEKFTLNGSGIMLITIKDTNNRILLNEKVLVR